MSADQLGDNRPQLPNSDGELVKYLYSAANEIRASFTDYAMGMSYSEQSIYIPTLGGIINLFKLEKGCDWHFTAEKQDQPGSPTVWIDRAFEGTNNQGKKVATGTLRLTTNSGDQKLMYGVSRLLFLYPLSEELKPTASLIYSEPLEEGRYMFKEPCIDLFTQGRSCKVSYTGTFVGNPKYLAYMKLPEFTQVKYHIPFFRRDEKTLTKDELQRAYNLTEKLYEIAQEPNNPDISSFIKEVGDSDAVYIGLGRTLVLNEPGWYQSSINILRLNEIAQYLEYRYRQKKEIPETSYRDYENRLQLFSDFLWVLSTGFVHGGRRSRWVFNKPMGISRSPGCPYPDLAFPGDLCLKKCWLKFCPRGLGPFDPGPHNPSAPNDPRGRDPRGLFDPRGPR